MTTAKKNLALLLISALAALAFVAASALVAPPASAATKPTITFTMSRASLDLGLPVSVQVSAKSGSRVVSGAVGLYVNGKKAVHRTGVRGTATIDVPPTSLRKGSNTVHVNFDPSDKSSYAWTTTTPKNVKVGATKVAVEAMKHVGVPYMWGGTTTKGFDCSGFTQYVYAKAVGVKLPRVSGEQAKVGKKVSAKAAKPGDLIASPGHIAIYLGEGYQIDAPKPGRTIAPRPVWQKDPTYIRVSAAAIK